MNYMKLVFTCFVGLASLSLQAQEIKKELRAEENTQVAFPQTVAAGNYSGITWLGGNEYAVVCDKSRSDGFFVFHINTDPDTGQISHAYCDEFRSADRANRDQEGICYVPKDSAIWISGEGDNRIREYNLKTGERTGRELDIPDSLKQSYPNMGFEALTYNAKTGHFWTVSESVLPIDGKPCTPKYKTKNRLRLLCFDESLKLVAQYPYEMDMPELKSNSAENYCIGVSDLCALDDGRLILLERELYAPRLILGSFVVCKLYVVDPEETGYATSLHKKLLLRFKTPSSGLKKDFANYEGMCLGPKLNDGRQVIVMMADSQNQMQGVLKDWLKTVVVNEQ